MLMIAVSAAVSQNWHVVDNGGGVSTSGTVELRSSVGQSSAKKMSALGNVLESGYIPGLRQFTIAGVMAISNENSWNLLSVPLIVGDFRKTILYPSAASSAFAYNGSYQRQDTLHNGKGYWMSFTTEGSLYYTGASFSEETLDVNDGWNIIGTVSYLLPITHILPIPPTSITSNYFGYTGANGYYNEDTLQPGMGYWLRVTNSGKIVLNAGSVAVTSTSPSVPSNEQAVASGDRQDGSVMNTLIIRDAHGQERTLYFMSLAESSKLSQYQLPPLPPEGMMDVRF